MKSSVQSTAQLAQVLGLSRWTVSRALNGHAGVNPQTVKRVVDAASKHGFAPSMLGRGLRSGVTNIIGVCLPDLVSYYLTDKIARIQSALESYKYFPIFQMTGETVDHENMALGRFSAMKCAGILSLASRIKPNSPALRSIQASGIPIIRIDPLVIDKRGVIGSDRAWAMKEAVQHFQLQGHRKMVTFGITQNSAYGVQRIEGLKAACKNEKNKGISWNFEKDIIPLSTNEATDHFNIGVILATKYLELPSPRPTAILALNDRIALGAISVLRKNGVQVPQDVSMIGYDNAGFTPHTDPPLTTIDPHPAMLIDQAVELLLSSKKNPRNLPSSPILIKPSLIVRASTAEPIH